ncbi:MAG: PAS domain S-box protein [Desulfarculaceae bacterium]|nr:PAS domain S-box protein [Desulfarculaceae bacterium]MCF8071474.1 PAS domain S-box protein [Desulfarculaceae bacterium]MCF8103398.1 PAS domain S-box protein [Desulfarculaceae bacterium]MCF8118058.1 PAS domain S-box protein [Desulfarculaceae bacterium]
MSELLPAEVLVPSELPDATFRRLFHFLPIPTLFLSPDKRVLAASRSFLERYGLADDQVLERPCYEVFHRGNQPCPASVCRFPAAMQGHQGLYNIHQYRNSLGRLVVEEVHLSPCTDQQGRVIGVIESVRDISEAKRLENSLSETNELFSCLLNSMLGVVVAADLQGRILFVNHNAKPVLGYEPEELLDKTLWELSPHEELKRLRGILDASRGPVRGVRTQVTKKEGETIPVKVNLNYIHRNGVPIGTLGIITDLREMVKIERHLNSARMQVVQSDKLAVLGRMAAGVAHELNNPLTGITVYTDLVRESLPPDHPAQQDLTFIAEDVDRCRDIVRDLLDYSRQGSIELETLDLSKVVEEAYALIRADSLSLHLKVITDFASQPLPIQGDRKLLRQVFINLISNAMDAMEGDGKITMRTYEDDRGMRCAEISDTGPGIPSEHLAKVFEPFFTTKEPGKGTGLGLSVVFGVIARHEGHISVKESGPQGTTFLVSLPASAPKTLQDFADKINGGEEDETIG